MLIFIGGAGSRLGNQIFQYAFIKSLAKQDESIIVSGFEHLIEIFEIQDVKNIPQHNKLVKGFMFRVISPILNFLGLLGLISTIDVNYEFVKGFRRENESFKEKHGLLKFIRYIKFGFFQSEAFFNKEVLDKLKIRSHFIKQAEEFLKDIPTDTHKIFVHIRRGDYKEITILGESALLPLTYYENLVESFNKEHPKCFFIFLSDEPEFTEYEFKNLANKKISRNNHPGTDFAIMTKCKSGILSTSTFGWWAAYLIQDKGTLYAPKYWLGFNSKIEFPAKGFPSFANEIEIQ